MFWYSTHSALEGRQHTAKIWMLHFGKHLLMGYPSCRPKVEALGQAVGSGAALAAQPQGVRRPHCRPRGGAGLSGLCGWAVLLEEGVSRLPCTFQKI